MRILKPKSKTIPAAAPAAVAPVMDATTLAEIATPVAEMVHMGLIRAETNNWELPGYLGFIVGCALGKTTQGLQVIDCCMLGPFRFGHTEFGTSKS